MGLRIQQLPPLLANQIAAGEVIERPASVVKELLENSLDAGATAITLDVSYGGLNQIKISDNGMGILAEDLPLAVAPHATSKIKTLDDLYSIESMGFRGEALASIASVATVIICSKPKQQETAMMLEVHGTEIMSSPCARTIGTTVEVLDLFFNAPVRKRFLKSEKLEFQAIETLVKRFAFSAPGVSILLKHNGKEVFSLPAARCENTQKSRLTRILGSSFVKEAIYLNVDHGSLKLHGWISNTTFQRSQSDRLWVYINYRMVKDKLIHQALKQAYEGLLHPGRFPACVLYLSIDPTEVDVNVHPTKHEVRFQQPRLIFDFFTSQLQAALSAQRESSQELKPNSGMSMNQAQELYESYPKLTFMQEQAQEFNQPWIFLNHPYILVFLHQKPYLVDLIALQRDKVQKQLSELALPWSYRPLLVPIRYSLPSKMTIPLSDIIEYLGPLGIHLEDLGNQSLLIRSIPVCLPYLDLRLFLEAVFDLEVLSQSKLLELMGVLQVFDPRVLSAEERIELHEFLLQSYRGELSQIGLFKALTVDECRKFLDV